MVNTSWRGVRTNSGVFSASSNWRTWWLMAVGVTDSSAAANLALRWRAAASKARSADKGGKVRALFMDEFYFAFSTKSDRLSEGCSTNKFIPVVPHS